MGKMHVVTFSGKVIIVSIGNSAHIDVCFSTLVSTIWWVSLDIYTQYICLYVYINTHSICSSNKFEKRLVLKLSCSFTILEDKSTISSWVLVV